MKLHISVGQPDLAGYINIDVGKHSVDLASLDQICGPSACTDMIINDVLKFIPYEKIVIVLQHLASRLRHNSKLTLIFTDINSIIRSYNNGEVDEKIFNRLMFNQGANSCFSYTYIQRILNAIKLNILSIEISKEQVIIVAERP